MFFFLIPGGPKWGDLPTEETVDLHDTVQVHHTVHVKEEEEEEAVAAETNTPLHIIIPVPKVNPYIPVINAALSCKKKKNGLADVHLPRNLFDDRQRKKKKIERK